MSLYYKLCRINEFAPRIIDAGDRVLVAVSGGPDSLSLLHVLHHLRESWQIADLSAAHLDHGLRGEESRAEAEFVAKFCAEREIPCVVEIVDIAAAHHATRGSKQEIARAVRYEFLQSTASRLGANKIATGHTEDDHIETVLFNILRGTGPNGLAGIPPRRDNIIRPFRHISRADIEKHCEQFDLAPRRDPSNDSPEHYTRNRIRLELLPLLERDYAPGVRKAILRLSAISNAEQDYIHEEAERALAAAIVSEEPALVLNRAALEPLHLALLRAVLRSAIKRRRRTLENLSFDFADGIAFNVKKHGQRTYSLTTPEPNCIVCVDDQHVSLIMSQPAGIAALTYFCPYLSVPGVVQIELLGLQVSAETSLQQPPVSVEHGVIASAALDADHIMGSLTVRNWRQGDRIDPLGMGGKTKKLQNIFTDAKIPRNERHRIVIVADARGPLWVAGHVVAERVRVRETTMRRLLLRLEKMEE